MQLSRLYSNLDDLFSPIDFNCEAEASSLNVVFAKVTRPKERDGDSHNLGKTTLIYLLDFLLLKNITSTSHFLEEHAERFSNFVFFLELSLDKGGFVTVRRSVSDPTRIAFKKTLKRSDLSEVSLLEWDHRDVPLEGARALLDTYLDLRMVSPWDYRKGVSYFLRTQEDYLDYFQIQKFVQGKDREWKPYLACVLGLDHASVHLKYILDEKIDELTHLRDTKKSEIEVQNASRGEVVTRIDIARDEIGQMDARLDNFDFREEERRISIHVVQDVEAEISKINDELYNLDSDIAQLERSIDRGMKFDLSRIKEIFEDSKIAFPDAISKTYEELIEFNKRLTKERNSALRGQVKALNSQRDGLAQKHESLNADRQRLLEIVKDADTFKKFKALQKEQAKRRAELAYLEGQLVRIDVVEDVERQLRDLRSKRDESITAIELSLNRGSGIKTSVTQLFNRFVKQVLNVNGEFIVGRNKVGNLEFGIRIKDAAGRETSQDKGHSYHRLLCALFDLAVLKALERMPFYHFVYHDGIFEGLDNRVKLRLLELIRSIIADGKIQYVLSVIDSDLPRDLITGEPIYFSSDEIVLTLHDQGDAGRLFKMPPF